jgi:hypothetical protein
MDLTRPLIQVGIAPFSIDRVVEDCVLLVIVSEHVPMFLKHFHGWQIRTRNYGDARNNLLEIGENIRMVHHAVVNKKKARK